MRMEQIEAFLEDAAKEVWFEADRDADVSREYKDGFKAGVDALQAAFLAALPESDG